MSLLLQQIAELDSSEDEVEEGTYTFIRLVGTPILPRKEAEILERRGVDGMGIRFVGTKARPFQLQTLNYLASFSAADAALEDYQALIAKQYGVKLTKNALEVGIFDVIGVDVAEETVAVSAAKVSGVAIGAAVRHSCVWTLMYNKALA
jgi:hypothetical protein